MKSEAFEARASLVAELRSYAESDAMKIRPKLLLHRAANVIELLNAPSTTQPTPTTAGVTEAMRDRLHGWLAGTFAYTAYRGRAPDGVPQLRSDVRAALEAALSTAPAGDGVPGMVLDPTAVDVLAQAKTSLGRAARALAKPTDDLSGVGK